MKFLTPSHVAPPPYKPLISLSQRFAKAKVEVPSKKFVELLRKIHRNVPFTEALSQMPTYAKFLKDILANKIILEGNETVAMIVNNNAIIQNMLPTKFKDSGSFSIPYSICNMIFDRALCDLWP